MKPDIGPIGDAFESGFRVSTAYLPTKVRFDDEYPVKDFHYINGLDFVSTRARDLIESFEPGVHQFEPVEYVRTNGDHVTNMFVMFVCRRIDSVDRSHSNMILYRNLIWITAKHAQRRCPDLVSSGTDMEAPPKKVFSLSQIGDAHMWRDIYTADQQYMSAELIAAIKAAGLIGLAILPEEFAP